MWLLRQNKARPLARGTEHAYQESVRVIDGECVCKHEATRQHLGMLGYQTIAKFDRWEELIMVGVKHAINLGLQGLGPLRAVENEQLVEMRNAHAAGEAGVEPYIRDLIEDFDRKRAPVDGPVETSSLSAADAMRLQAITP